MVPITLQNYNLQYLLSKQNKIALLKNDTSLDAHNKKEKFIHIDSLQFNYVVFFNRKKKSGKPSFEFLKKYKNKSFVLNLLQKNIY